MTSPAIGTYLRPVGTFRMCYCGRLERVVGPTKTEWDREPWTQFQLTRYALDREHMEPVEDGRQSQFYLSDLVEVAPGLWRDRMENDWDLEPLYWREMGQRGQLNLFGMERAA